MAEAVVNTEIKVNLEDAKQKVWELSYQLKNAQETLKQAEKDFGFWGEEAVMAAGKVGEISDALTAAKQELKSFAVEGETVLKAFDDAANGLVGGFSSLNGLLGLVVEHSEAIDSAIEKVKTALEIQEQIEGIKKAGEAFKNLGSVLGEVATKGFGSIKAAIIETGIGALVIGLTLVISKLWDWISGSEAAKKAQEDLKKSTASINETLQDQQTQLSNTERLAISRAKASGASEQQIFQTQQFYARQNALLLQQAIKDKEEQLKKFEQFREKDEASEKAYQEAMADLKKSQQDLEKANIDYEVRENERKAQQRAEEQAKQKQAADEAKQREQERKERRKQEAEDAKKREEEKRNRDRQAADDELETAKNKSKNLEALDEAEAKRKGKSEDEIFKIQQDARKRDIDDLDIYAEKLKTIYGENSKEYKKALRDIADAQVTYNVAAINEQIRVANLQKEQDKQINDKKKQDAANAATKQKEIQDKQEEIDKKKQAAIDEIDEMSKGEYQNQLDKLKKWNDEKYALIKGNEEEETKLKKLYAQKKLNVELNLASSLLGQAADLFGKQTVAGKTFAVAQATIDTYKAANSAYASMAGIPVVGPALGAVAAGIAIAAGIKNVKAIVATKIAGVSDNTSATGINVSGSPAAPLTPQIQQSNTQLNQNQLNQIGNATVRAFVLESDVSNNQEKIARLNRAARLGG